MMSSTKDSTRAYIGLGSNLADPVKQVKSALRALDGITATRCVGHSSLYLSSPLGFSDQPDYINAVAAVDTMLSPPDLLRNLHDIERRHGRVRTSERWGPRTLDLDLLLYGMEKRDDNDLTIPHPGLCERNFVLYPLYEIAPELSIPGLGRLCDFIDQCSKSGLKKVEKSSEAIAS